MMKKQVTRIAKDQIPHLETLESDSEVVIFKVEEDLFEITPSVQALIECNRSKYETSSRHPGQCRRFLSPILSNSLVLQISLALCYRYVLLIPRRKSWGDAKEMDRFNKGRSKYSSGAVTTIGNWVLVLAFLKLVIATAIRTIWQYGRGQRWIDGNGACSFTNDKVWF